MVIFSLAQSESTFDLIFRHGPKRFTCISLIISGSFGQLSPTTCKHETWSHGAQHGLNMAERG